MYEKLVDIVKGIESFEASLSSFSSTLRSSGEVFPEALEKELAKKVSPMLVNAKVCAVDGGLLAQEFHGFDLVVARAVGAIFEYKDSLLFSHKYFPSAFPGVELDVLPALESHDFNWHKNLFRLKKELETAIVCVKNFAPNYIFLDGSIVPLVSDKPSEDSPIHHYYSEVISLYKELYSECEKSDCTLIGIIKDSRGKRFIEVIEKKFRDEEILKKTSDTNIINFLLTEGERTFVFPYSTDFSKNQVLKDLGDWGRKINAFYVKPVAKDRPLRVEFLNSKKSFDEVASIVFSLSRINQSYAYPAVLIEADLRAALDRIELERAYREIILKTGLRSTIMPLRRDSRPFR